MHSTVQSWQIEFDTGIPVYKQLIHQIQSDIAQGKLKIGDKLPTIKAVKEHLQINPNTVVKAYRELELGGMIISQRGSGCYISAQPETEKLSHEEKQIKLESLYQRLCSEAKSFGISTSDLQVYISKQK